MPKVYVTRNGLQNGARAYQVDIDGATYGALRMRGKLEADVPAGTHTVVIGLDSSATFDNSDGRDTHIEFRASKWNNRAKITINR